VKSRWSLRELGTAYVAFVIAIALAALATRVLGEKMVETMVQLMGVFVVP
jgi:hypothetical protein